MSISALSILKDGTVSATGGTATTVITKGQDLGQHNVVLEDGSEFINQTEVAFLVSNPKVNSGAPNGYTQARSTAVIYVPLALDNSSRTTNSLSLKLAVDHETTDAEIESMLVYGGQLLTNSALAAFWKKQSLS